MAATEKDAAAIATSRELNNVPRGEQYERMISGMLYDCFAPELMDGRFKARRFMNKFNNYFPDDATNESLTQEREAMLRAQFGRIGTEPFIEPPLSIDYGCNIIIGDRFFANFNLVILDCALVRIGDRVMIGPSVSIFAATHETGAQSRRDMIEYAREVTIGDDCWIGGNVVIMPGVTIGKGSTVGAGSVVTKDIPDFSLAIGSPARVVKKLEPVEDLPKSA